MNSIDWIILLISLNVLLGTFYLGVRLGEFKLRKQFLKSVFKDEIEVVKVQDLEDDDWGSIGRGPLN